MKEFLFELNEQIVSKSFNQIDITKLRYYYKEIYGKPINEKCSNCLQDAYYLIKRHYRAKLSELQTETWTENDIYYLNLAYLEFNTTGSKEHCKWIKNKIKQLKK